MVEDLQRYSLFFSKPLQSVTVKKKKIDASRPVKRFMKPTDTIAM